MGGAGARGTGGRRELNSSPVCRGARRSRPALMCWRLFLLRRGCSGVGARPVRRGVLVSRGGAEQGPAFDVGTRPHGPGAGA